MASIDTGYVYGPLRAASVIRLIKILPEKLNGKVMCILSHFEQAGAPPYDALSYCWGDATPTGTIYLGNDVENVHAHPLHESLLGFLGCMWEQQKFDKFFWTDSLCLNQKDSGEKSQQVPRMRDIYANANAVVMWLGHEAEKEEKMRMIRDWPIKEVEGSIELDSKDIKNMKAHYLWNAELSVLKQGDSWKRQKEASNFLSDLPYWSRVWIIQEVALSRRAVVACGNVALDLETFRRKMYHHQLQRKRVRQGTFNEPFWELCRLHKERTKQPLWRLLRNFSQAESSLPVDRVYGLLGLVDDSEKEKLIVDYEKTTIEVYWDAMLACRAPWTEYIAVMDHLLLLDPQPETRTTGHYLAGLKAYVNKPRTSRRHILLAEIVARVVEAAPVLAGEMEISDWLCATCCLCLECEGLLGEHSELQNAVIIGLLHSSCIEEADSLARSGLSDGDWKLERVKLLGDGASCRRFEWGVRVTTPVPKTVSEVELRKIGKPVHFVILGRSLVVEGDLDMEHGPGKVWTMLLSSTWISLEKAE